MKRIISLVFFLSTVTCNIEPKVELKLVFTVFRHGDRSPIEIYPKDKNKADKWPMGLGELTEIGKKDAYDLGVYFRDRYRQKLDLSSEFQASSPEFMIRSTAIHRAQLSAVYFLAGFYQEDFKNVLEKEDDFVKKYHVPYTPENEDQLLSMADCPTGDRLLEVWKKTSKEWKAFEKKYAILDALLKYTGWTDRDQLNHLADDVYCEMSHNLTQPDFITNGNNLKTLMEFFDESKKFVSPTTKLQQIGTGPLMSRLVKAIDDKIHSDSKEKMLIFSAHDTNVINFLTGLKSFNDRQPPYSAAAIVELYQKDKMYYINLFYHNDSSTTPHLFTVPGCEHNVSLCRSSILRKVANKVAISQHEREELCGPYYKSHSLKLSDNVIPITVCIVIFVCAILALIMYRVYRRKRRPRGDPMMYRPLAYGEDEDEDI